MSTSLAEQEFCTECIQKGIRIDGRGVNDYRPVEVQLGLIVQANGSARLRVGASDVLVCSKLECETPDASTPDEGRLQVSVECSACASPEYEGRGGEQWASSLAAALEASLLPGRGSGAAHAGVDTRQLCILPGKRCWAVYVDALVLNDDGNVLSALSLAALAALADTRVPAVSIAEGGDGGGGGAGEPELELDDDMDAATRLELGGVPVVVSVSQVGTANVLDLSLAEEPCAQSTLHVAVDASGRVCGVTKQGVRGVDPATAAAMLEIAQATAPRLVASLRKHLAAVAAASDGA